MLSFYEDEYFPNTLLLENQCVKERRTRFEGIASECGIQ